MGRLDTTAVASGKQPDPSALGNHKKPLLDLEKFSANATPPVASTGFRGRAPPLRSQFTGNNQATPTLFGGMIRATEFKETTINIADDAPLPARLSESDPLVRTLLGMTSVDCKSDPIVGIGSSPSPPALPEELLAALSLAPGSAIPRSKSGSCDIPRPETSLKSSGLNLLTAFPLPMDLARSSSRNGSSSTRPFASNLSQQTSSVLSRHMIQYRESGQPYSAQILVEQPETPQVTLARHPVDTTRLASPIAANTGSRTLRKAASVDSLNTAAEFHPDKPLGHSHDQLYETSSTAWPQTKAEVKGVWRSFANKLHLRPGKQRDTLDTSRPVSLVRKSFDSSTRHSLSIYPRRSADKSQFSTPTQSTSRGDNSLRDTDIFIRGHVDERTVRSSRITSPCALVTLDSQASLGTSTESDEGGSWLGSENFTIDLSQRNKRLKTVTRTVLARYTGRQSGTRDEISRDEEEEELLGQGVIPLNSSEDEDGASEHAVRVTDLMPTEPPLTLEVPPNMSADGHLRTQVVAGTKDARESQKEALTPIIAPDTASTIYVDAFSSPVIPTPPSPTPDALYKFPDTQQGSSAPMAFGIVPAPPSPHRTLRPRSMSEGCILGGQHSGLHQRAARLPNKAGLDIINDRNGLEDRSNQHVAFLRYGSKVGLVSASHEEVNPEGSLTRMNDEVQPSQSELLVDVFDVQPLPQNSLADYVVAIIGAKGVGKSAVIVRNLRMVAARSMVLLTDHSGNQATSYFGTFSVTGLPCTIQILEVDMDILEDTSEGFSWPASLPHPEGVIICYKYGDPKGLEQLKGLLHGFWTRGGLHLIALATQCPPSPRAASSYKVEGDKAAEICNIYGAGLVHLDGGLDDPHRKAKNSLQWVLRKILESKGHGSRSASRCTRMMSRKTSSALLQPVESKNGSSSESATLARVEAGDSTYPSTQLLTSVVASVRKVEEPFASPVTSDFLDTSSAGISPGPVDTDPSQLDIHLSRVDLVQKFLYESITGEDEEYLSTFLIVFRRFETPYKLLSGLIESYHSASQYLESDPLLSRHAQTSILLRWIESHPNDFCSSATSAVLRSFYLQLYGCSHCQGYAVDIETASACPQSAQDLDAAWTIPDIQDFTPSTLEPLSASGTGERKSSIAMSIESTISTISNVDSVQTSAEYSTPSTTSAKANSRQDVTPALLNTAAKSIPSLLNRNRSQSDIQTNASSDTSSQLSTSNEALARQMIKMYDTSNMLLLTPIQPLARQITKISWKFFSIMQPRDLLRYVLTPRDPKFPDAPPMRSEQNPVTSAIKFSNHLSSWTASVILVQKKPKNRVRAMEHLISLALALRSLDNFDCLMSVLVGLNSTPVHRLDDVASAVSEPLYKKFRSMNRLMAASRSFSAYRLAIANARPENIPYLGVHLQDIKRIQDGKSDMRDGLVNWSKMRQVGSLVMEAPVFSLDDDDDTLYELSYSYKPRQKRSGSNSQTARLKRLLKEAISPPQA